MRKSLLSALCVATLLPLTAPSFSALAESEEVKSARQTASATSPAQINPTPDELPKAVRAATMIDENIVHTYADELAPIKSSRLSLALGSTANTEDIDVIYFEEDRNKEFVLPYADFPSQPTAELEAASQTEDRRESFLETVGRLLEFAIQRLQRLRSDVM